MTFTTKRIQIALNHAGFGWFNLKVFIVSGLMVANTAISLGNISLIVPAAACDLKMSTIAKGQLVMMPMLGMIVGQYFWCLLAELKGRKKCLIASLYLHGLSDGVVSIISNYWGFLICKFLNGVAVSGQLAVLYTYLGVFQPCKYRDLLLSLMELSWDLGLIVATGLGRAIIPSDFGLSIPSIYFFFNSCNLYLMICSLLAPIVASLLVFIPETPKYLAETGNIEEYPDDCMSNVLHYNVYSYNIILCFAVLPTAIWLPLGVRRLGFKFHLIVCSLCSGVLALAFFMPIRKTRKEFESLQLH